MRPTLVGIGVHPSDSPQPWRPDTVCCSAVAGSVAPWKFAASMIELMQQWMLLPGLEKTWVTPREKSSPSLKQKMQKVLNIDRWFPPQKEAGSVSNHLFFRGKLAVSFRNGVFDRIVQGWCVTFRLVMSDFVITCSINVIKYNFRYFRRLIRPS